MLRNLLILSFAATAVATAASAASPENSTTVSLAGKSPEAIAADVRAAAVKVCKAELRGSPLALYLADGCISSTVETTMDAIASSPKLTVAVNAAPAVR